MRYRRWCRLVLPCCAALLVGCGGVGATTPVTAPATGAATPMPRPASPTVFPSVAATPWATITATATVVAVATPTPPPPSPAVSASATTTARPASPMPVTSLVYFWPVTLPMRLEVQPGQSRADEMGFTLELAQPGGGQFRVTIVGGQAVQADLRNPPRGARTVTVRGQPGFELNTGAGSTIYWTEAGQVYGVISGLAREDALAIADGLQSLDLAGWRQRLATP